jgi:hypothetical protein
VDSPLELVQPANVFHQQQEHGDVERHRKDGGGNASEEPEVLSREEPGRPNVRACSNQGPDEQAPWRNGRRAGRVRHRRLNVMYSLHYVKYEDRGRQKANVRRVHESTAPNFKS